MVDFKMKRGDNVSVGGAVMTGQLTAGEAELVPLAAKTEHLLSKEDPLATARTTLRVTHVNVL